MTTWLAYDSLITTSTNLLLLLDCNSLEDLDVFIAESVIMKNFKHKNVLSLVGVSVGAENELAKPYIISPFMVNKDLKKYLQCKRREMDNNLEAVLEVCSCIIISIFCIETHVLL